MNHAGAILKIDIDNFMSTTQEIEIQDTAAKIAVGADNAEDAHGKKMVLNMGPSLSLIHI